MNAPAPKPSSDLQQVHYEAIHDDYHNHYFDEPSMDYRRVFCFPKLLAGHDLNDQLVGELACGSGENSLELRAIFPRARFEGFDISQKACADYRAAVGAPAHHADLTKPMTGWAGKFDALVIIGGIHHCIVDLPTTLANMAHLLKPGGKLFMLEPNKKFFLQSARDSWYRKDRYFEASTEEALDHDAILKIAGPVFNVDHVTYFGGPAYFIIVNSLIFRIPLWAKPWLKRPMFWLERWYNKMKNPALFPAFTACWIKKA